MYYDKYFFLIKDLKDFLFFKLEIYVYGIEVYVDIYLLLRRINRSLIL